MYKKDEINDLRIAIPGKSFSGYFYYKLFFNSKEEVVVRFDEIINSVVKGEVDKRRASLTPSRWGKA